ncbi:Bax inhibitor-1/YccA family protein [Lapillicoccus jejuensis]|uniref:Putative YccA/Bax inhibitor family protein n=1 Tax=Lapillicoccus jejuensis TaxID=402171 RepID=A0A542E1L5_9MICO|nr:Bax inhibitor-1/YccA family protein [Lapillicoccus jejuensis]TQJ09232.1 putative YccA/Bax inhibitor family protein [Lapillicoccus jejuensis]
MAGNNPVFSKFEQQASQQGYAGFGRNQAPTYPPQYPGPQGGYGPQDLDALYQQPSAGPLQTGRLTVDDVVMKTLGLFVLVLAAGGVSWVLTDSQPALTTPLWLGGMLVGLGLGLAISFMKKVSVPLILLYAVAEGLFLGAFSRVMEAAFPGVVTSAVVATLATFAGMFAGYRFGIIKVTDKSRRIFGLAILGYLVFSLVNVVALLAGWTSGWGFGGGGMLGIAISLLGVGLAAYSLAMDFDSIDRAVRAQVPQQYSWLLAHGLIVSLVWLYVEMLRLFARLRD